MHDLTLILFDIDGTLLDMRGAGRRSFVRALEAVFGWRDAIAYIRFAGATDLDVLRRVFAHHGRALTPEDAARFFARLPQELERTAAATELVLYPGVRALLETLSRDAGVRLGLVTGNIEPCAMLKLRQFDLHGHFVLGAFGHEQANRLDLAVLALRRAEAQLPPGRRLARTFLIGDTPADIAAARHIGAVAVTVATGQFTAAELRQAGADEVLADFADLGHVLALLGRTPAGADRA